MAYPMHKDKERNQNEQLVINHLRLNHLINHYIAWFGTADLEWMACRIHDTAIFGSNCTPVNGIGVPADPNAPSLSSPEVMCNYQLNSIG